MQQTLTSSLRYTLLGSCFAQNMGERMKNASWQALVNPLGTLYNPASIALTIRSSLVQNPDIPCFFDEAMNEWRCWLANTRFRAESLRTVSEEIAKELRRLGESLRHSDVLIITLGTNVCYRLKKEGHVVTNCQRQPSALFEEYRMSQTEVEETLDEALQMLWHENPSLHVILTVSPYRYKKYGLHGSQLSKATLLLAEETLCQRYPDRVEYFPSYEIMMDELRDYRWYAEDGLHPSCEAVDVIWDRFIDNAL